MILQGVKLLQTRDVANYAWARLSQYQNGEHCSARIIALHHLEKQQHANARRQAEQIRHCLGQAREYFRAAEVVGMATRPLLLYYAAMSLSLAEILLKQTADSRLSKLRELHPAHGLALRLSGEVNPSDSLLKSAGSLVARAQYRADAPMGTFEVWRQSAREYPIGGYANKHVPHGATQTFAMLLVGADEPLPFLPATGISLLDCLRELPYLQDTLFSAGDGCRLVRATLVAHEGGDGWFNPKGSQDYALWLSVHPQPSALVDAFGEKLLLAPALVNHVEVREIGPGGHTVIFRQSPDARGLRMSFPPSISMSEKNTFFTCSNFGLNEFGYLYVALHISGTFARYYPDIWLKHIEQSSNLYLAIDELCNHAVERLALLAASEFTRIYHVVEH